MDGGTLERVAACRRMLRGEIHDKTMTSMCSIWRELPRPGQFLPGLMPETMDLGLIAITSPPSNPTATDTTTTSSSTYHAKRCTSLPSGATRCGFRPFG